MTPLDALDLALDKPDYLLVALAIAAVFVVGAWVWRQTK